MFDHSKDTCIEWDENLANGYGVVQFKGKQWLVHRLMMFLLKPEEFAKGLDVLHKCDNKKCYNPNHLYFGTQLDNEKDKDLRGVPVKWRPESREDQEPRNETVTITARVYEEHLDFLKKEASEYGTSLSAVMRVLISLYLTGLIDRDKVHALAFEEMEKATQVMKSKQFKKKKSEETAA